MMNKQTRKKEQSVEQISSQIESVIEEFKTQENDTGSSAIQIAQLTGEIKKMQGHFADHKKDNHSRYGLRQKIEKRRRLMKYMKAQQPEAYENLIKQLDIRG